MKLYTILPRSLAPLLMASTPPGEEEAPAPGGAITQVGSTTRVTAERTDARDPATGEPLTPAPEEKKAEERPEGLPEGFDSWEAYAKDRLAKDAAPGDETSPPPPPGPAETQATPEEIEALVTTALEAWPEEQRELARPFTEEFAKTGALSDETVKAAAAAFNVPEFVVRQYVEGAQVEVLRAELEAVKSERTAAQEAAAQEAANKPILDLFGGAERWDHFGAWAEENLTAAQLKAFNSAAATSPEAALELAATYQQLYEASGESMERPKDLTTNVESHTGSGSDVYATDAELHKDQRDPRYRSDATFRAGVEAKLARSTHLFPTQG